MPKIVFSSDHLSPSLCGRSRFTAWRNQFCEKFGENDFDISEAPFAVHTTFVQMNEVLIGHCTGTVTSSEHGDNKETSAAGRVGILINRSASTFYSANRGREQLVASGSGVFLKRAYARKIVGKDLHNEWVIVEMPERSLLPAGRNAEDLIGTVIPGDSECMRLLNGYASLLCSQPSVSDPLISAHTATTITDLATLALRSARDAEQQARERGLRSARLDTIIGEIADGYRDPTFSVAVVAARVRLSARTVQDLLQASGTGFRERVMELRLTHAARLIGQSSRAKRKISDVAYDCGFNDLSYFHRSFRRRFGMTPGDAKAA